MIEQAVLAAFLAFCRIGACFMLMPGFGSARVPAQVRLFVAVAASLALLFQLWEEIAPFVERSADALALLIVSEILIGALIGLVARFYVLALQFIGAAISLMVGFGAPGGGIALEEPEPQPALGAIISFSALLLLFVLDFHHQIVLALVESYRAVPIDTLFNARVALVNLADTISEAFFVMIRLGSPFVAYAILVNLAVGFVNKLTPQIPIYFISLPFIIAGGLIMIYFAIATMLSLFGDGFYPVTLGR